MLTKRDLFVRWFAYGAAAALLLLFSALFLRRVTLWGVKLFLPPVLLACIACGEERREAAIFGLVFGVCCDLAITAPIPCLYTLVFPAAALLASHFAKTVLQPGFLCALALSAMTFVLLDLLLILVLLVRAHASLPAMLSLAGRELAVSLLLLPVCYVVIRFVHGRVTL